MKLLSFSGKRILISPFLPWERKSNDALKISCFGVFRPSHITTKLCIALIEEELAISSYDSFLDVGCGSGIFALVAAKEGIPLVVGVDLSFRAVRISRENALKNNLTKGVHWINGSIESLSCDFGFIVANLRFHVLKELLDDMVKLMKLNGCLVISGFQDTEYDDILKLCEGQGLKLRRKISGDFTFFDVPPSGTFTWMAAKFTRI